MSQGKCGKSKMARFPPRLSSGPPRKRLLSSSSRETEQVDTRTPVILAGYELDYVLISPGFDVYSPRLRGPLGTRREHVPVLGHRQGIRQSGALIPCDPRRLARSESPLIDSKQTTIALRRTPR